MKLLKFGERKYRVCCQTTGDGNSRYFPQYRQYFIWRPMIDYARAQTHVFTTLKKANIFIMQDIERRLAHTKSITVVEETNYPFNQVFHKLKNE